METENKLITDLNVNSANLEHINTVNKLIDIISNLDNSAFKTLLSYIVSANTNTDNIQITLENGFSIVDEKEENEYLIEFKDSFFCVSILNSSIEEFIGEMITFQCSGLNDIFTSIIDEDILELNGNETAREKREIILNKMLKPMFVGLTSKIKDTIYTDLQFDIFANLLNGNMIRKISENNYYILKKANPEITVFIWNQLFGNYLKTENNLDDVINKYYSNNKSNILRIIREIFDNITLNIIIKNGYTYVSKKYPQINNCYELINNFFKNTENYLSQALKNKYHLIEKAIKVDLYNDSLFLKNREIFYKFIKKRLNKDCQDYVKNIVIKFIQKLIDNSNILDRYKEEFLINLFNINTVYEDYDILNIISKFTFSNNNINKEIQGLIYSLLKNNTRKKLDNDKIFKSVYDFHKKNMSIRELYDIILSTKHKPTFYSIVKYIVNNSNINVHDKAFIYKKILSNRMVIHNLLDVDSFNLIFNQNIYEVNHYITLVEAFGKVYLDSLDNELLVNVTNYYGYELCCNINKIFNIEQCFSNAIRRSSTETLRYFLNKSEFVQNNKKLLENILNHWNVNYEIKKQVNSLLKKINQNLKKSPETEILSNPLDICDENLFNVLKNSKSSMFVFFLMLKFNSEAYKFNDNEINMFIDKFIMNINIEPTFWFDNNMIMCSDKIKILSHIQSLFNNLSIMVKKDEFYSCNQDASYFILQTENEAIQKSKRSFDTFMRYLDLSFEGLSGAYEMIHELSIDYDSLELSEEMICNKYLSKIVYQKVKHLAESPMIYSELLHHMVNTSWFVQDKIDILEVIVNNPMCSKNTKDLIVNNVLKKKVVDFDELLDIKDKDFLVEVINNCKMSKETLNKFNNSEHKFKKDRNVNKAIRKKMEIKNNGKVLNTISKQQLELLNKSLSMMSSNISKGL